MRTLPALSPCYSPLAKSLMKEPEAHTEMSPDDPDHELTHEEEGQRPTQMSPDEPDHELMNEEAMSPVDES